MERDERDTHIGGQETKEVDSPATSVSRIAYWLRELPWTALHYLPEYLPYHAPESSHLSASEWVLRKQSSLFLFMNQMSLKMGTSMCTGTGLLSASEK